MLHYGNRNRTQHATDANAESSRSHAVFQVGQGHECSPNSRSKALLIQDVDIPDIYRRKS